MTVGVDFDGTIVRQVPYPSTEMKPLPYAVQSLKKLASRGFRLVLCSARYGWYRRLAADFIQANGLPVEVPKARLKPACDVYIDDRNFECAPIDWRRIVRKMTGGRR